MRMPKPLELIIAVAVSSLLGTALVWAITSTRDWQRRKIKKAVPKTTYYKDKRAYALTKMGDVPTWTLWRSKTGVIEDSCPSIGYPIQMTPYKYRSAFIRCIGHGKKVEPVYIRAIPTVYKYPIEIDYKTNRVYRVKAVTIPQPLKKTKKPSKTL